MPDSESHMGYRKIFFKSGKQYQVEEEANQAKDPVASKEALDEVAQAMVMKTMQDVKNTER